MPYRRLVASSIYRYITHPSNSNIKSASADQPAASCLGLFDSLAFKNSLQRSRDNQTSTTARPCPNERYSGKSTQQLENGPRNQLTSHSKYYPPDFDPSAIGRTPKHLRQTGPKVITVRLMAPFSMKCTHCGEYIYKGRKFNARKETTDQKYLNIPIYRFYIRCTRCSGEITFLTDPKAMDYKAEKGAKRNFEPWRDAKNDIEETEQETLDRLEREENEEQERLERDKMAELEEKMLDSKREMAIADALDEIRTRNARIERNEALSGDVALAHVRNEVDEARLREEKEIEEAARRAFTTETGEKVKRLVEDDTIAGTTPGSSQTETPPPPSFARVKKPKKPLINGLGIKKKPKPSLV
ncbi:Saf4/Yju2 family protein [Aspergillus fumigatus Af293]|uniref:Splicing factor YJU2 n=1 Tax=Aspergillus fumigatus (strain ATCC MYA-4609 / CBS 101355 / FGSC A1100 / Af293) TaxID=330879 RepID=Q4WED1_ASPFU|nr:mRNA splicing protein Yju2 [Aspergillus fumigatus Af293]EAL86046.1 mRNA splicing protein Yju2 [Aspergillus fumigatus Af293]